MFRGLVPLALVCLGTTPAWAQSGVDEGPRAQTIRAVERGVFFEGNFGFSYFATDVGEASVGPGPVLGAYLGFDLLPILNLSLGGTAVAAFSTSDGAVPTSDVFYAGPMARLQLAVLSSQRDFLWLRADGGVAFSLPSEVAGQSTGDPGAAVGGAVVFEHFTKLRHFSLGASLGAMVYTQPETAVSIQLAPLIKYTF